MLPIEIKEVSKRFGSLIACDQLSFRIAPGTIHGLLGPNGAGKTTLMKMLVGLMRPTSGGITIGEYSTRNDMEQIRRCVGILPEVPPLYPEMRVEPFLLFVAGIKGIAKDDIEREVAFVVEKTGLKEVLTRRIGNLSKGFRQRVGIAQAILGSPDVVILDEPTVGLDPSSIREIRELIQSLRTNHTILLSSHLLNEVEQICDEITIVSRGKLVATGHIDAIRSTVMAGKVFTLLLQDPPPSWRQEISELPEIDRVDSGARDGESRLILRPDISDEVRPKLIRWMVEKGWNLLEFREEHTELEALFLQLTEEE